MHRTCGCPMRRRSRSKAERRFILQASRPRRSTITIPTGRRNSIPCRRTWRDKRAPRWRISSAGSRRWERASPTLSPRIVSSPISPTRTRSIGCGGSISATPSRQPRQCRWYGWPPMRAAWSRSTPWRWSTNVCASRRQRELDGKDQREHEYRWLRLVESPRDELGQRVSDEAEPDPGRDGIGERHGDSGHHGGRIFRHVAPIDLGKTLGHDAGDVEKRCRRSVGRDHPGERRKEQRQKKEKRNERGGKACAPAGGNSRSTFDVARRCVSADQGTKHCGKAVGDQRLLHARQISLRIKQTGAMRNADKGTGIVE